MRMVVTNSLSGTILNIYLEMTWFNSTIFSSKKEQLLHAEFLIKSNSTFVILASLSRFKIVLFCFEIFLEIFKNSSCNSLKALYNSSYGGLSSILESLTLCY